MRQQGGTAAYLVGTARALDVPFALLSLATLALAASLPFFQASHLGLAVLHSLAAASTGSGTALSAAAAGCWCAGCGATVRESGTGD